MLLTTENDTTDEGSEYEFENGYSLIDLAVTDKYYSRVRIAMFLMVLWFVLKIHARILDALYKARDSAVLNF